MFLDLSVSASWPANMHATKRPIYGIADKAPFYGSQHMVLESDGKAGAIKRV